MIPCPAFAQALTEERDAAFTELLRSVSPESRTDALARLADLDDLGLRALDLVAPPS